MIYIIYDYITYYIYNNNNNNILYIYISTHTHIYISTDLVNQARKNTDLLAYVLSILQGRVLDLQCSFPGCSP